MGIHSRCSSGLSNSSLATSRVYSAWNPRERERERDGKKKHSISHWLWRLTAVRRGSTTLVLRTRNNYRNAWQRKQHSFRIPFSHPGNLINRERKIIILYSFDGAIVPDSTDPWDVCLPGRFDGIISRKKRKKEKEKKEERYVNIHVVTKTASTGTSGGTLAPRFLGEAFEIRRTGLSRLSHRFHLFYSKFSIPREYLYYYLTLLRTSYSI